MTFIEFIKVFGNDPVIDMRNVTTYFNGLDRRRLFEWQKKGYLSKIVSNFYILSDKKVDADILKHLACRVYAPCYIGLESALAYYHFIPEAVFQVIAITTRRNRLVRSRFGDLRYRSIKPDLFFGYRVVDFVGGSFFISDPEKSLLDVLYFLPQADKKATLEGLRLNLDEIRQTIDVVKLRDYLKLFASPKLARAAAHVMEMAHVEF